MSEEYLDILNELGEQTGDSRSYLDAHKYGLIHRAVHVWVLNRNNQILLQKRSSDRQAYPDHWDISASGHVSAGETSLEAAHKETQEELGLILSDSTFNYLFTIEEHIVLNDGTYVNNEFQDVYVVRLDDTHNLKIDTVELADVKWIDLDQFKKQTKDSQYKFVPHEEEYQRLSEYIEKL